MADGGLAGKAQVVVSVLSYGRKRLSAELDRGKRRYVW